MSAATKEDNHETILRYDHSGHHDGCRAHVLRRRAECSGRGLGFQFDVQTGELDTLKTFQTMDPETFPEEYRDDLRTLQSQITESLAGDLLFSK